jgi:hypothetical protein
MVRRALKPLFAEAKEKESTQQQLQETQGVCLAGGWMWCGVVWCGVALCACAIRDLHIVRRQHSLGTSARCTINAVNVHYQMLER